MKSNMYYLGDFISQNGLNTPTNHFLLQFSNYIFFPPTCEQTDSQIAANDHPGISNLTNNFQIKLLDKRIRGHFTSKIILKGPGCWRYGHQSLVKVIGEFTASQMSVVMNGV